MSKKRKQQAASKEPMSEMPVNTESSHQDEDNYRIYTYLKNNPGLFAGSGAVIIAILSALISLCSYLFENAYLRYWKIDPVYIDLDSASRLYSTIVSFAFLGVSLLIFSLLESIANKYAPLKEKGIYLRTLKEIHSKQLLKHHVKKRFRFLPCNTKPIDGHTDSAGIAIDKLESSFTDAEKPVRKQIRGFLIFLGFFMFLFSCIWTSVHVQEVNGSILILTFGSLLLSVIIITVGWWIPISTMVHKDTVKDSALCDYNALTIKADVPVITFPLKSLFSGEYKHKIPDQRIKDFLVSCILFLAIIIPCVIFTFLVLGNQQANNQTEFMLISQDNIEYAIIYNNGEYAILAPYCHNKSDNTITIDSSVQQVISIEGMKYTIGSFEKAYNDKLPDYRGVQETPTE